jgi:hypothetical protein
VRATQDPNVSLDSDAAAWAKDHQASFESEPLIEMRGTEKVTVGFTLTLYARLPMEKPPGPERQEAGASLWQRLRGILESALAEGSGGSRVDIEPMRAAAVLRPENEMQPEVALRARVVHPETFQAVTPGERDKMATFEKKLVAMGLRAGHW